MTCAVTQPCRPAILLHPGTMEDRARTACCSCGRGTGGAGGGGGLGGGSAGGISWQASSLYMCPAEWHVGQQRRCRTCSSRMATDIHTYIHTYNMHLQGCGAHGLGASWLSSGYLSLRSAQTAWLLLCTYARYHRLHCSDLETFPSLPGCLSSHHSSSSTTTTAITTTPSPPSFLALSSRVHVPALA